MDSGFRNALLQLAIVIRRGKNLNDLHAMRLEVTWFYRNQPIVTLGTDLWGLWCAKTGLGVRAPTSYELFIIPDPSTVPISPLALEPWLLLPSSPFSHQCELQPEDVLDHYN